MDNDYLLFQVNFTHDTAIYSNKSTRIAEEVGLRGSNLHACLAP